MNRRQGSNGPDGSSYEKMKMAGAQVMVNPTLKRSERLTLTLVIGWVIIGTSIEFYNIAWGTGVWWGEFAMSWALIFFGYLLFCLIFFAAANYLIWRGDNFSEMRRRLIRLRDQFARFRWVLYPLVVILPVYLFRYTIVGFILHGYYFRVTLWGLTVLLLAMLSTNDESLIGGKEFLASAILSASIISVVAALMNVTDYPFSLGWSEGNRMWDYSLLFGSNLYNYPAERPPTAYLDIGRQLSGGLPFLFTHLTILQERLWVGLMTLVPYILLGWIAFRLPGSEAKFPPFLAGLWAWMFLNQGPIHAPLLGSAILVALSWGGPLWLVIPVVAIASFFAFISRFTWVFAPAMWAATLELGSMPPMGLSLRSRHWQKLLPLILGGLAAGFFASKWFHILDWISTYFQSPAVLTGLPSISLASIIRKVADQPLLWYRWLPNATYGNGILLGLMIAVMPVMIVLVYLYIKRIWILNIWQRLAIILSLSAFLAVGLIVSAKIGGGGDLHNMDMFLIGVMFSAALVWRARGHQWISGVESFPRWMRLVVLLLIALPAFKPLMSLHPISFAGDAEWLAVLSDVRTARALGVLPSDTTTESALQMIRQSVQEAQAHGEVLFMDQRQLLTFGYIQNVELVPEYEKKAMMDKALSSDAAYFAPFYSDLAAHRFSLIISDPLGTPIKDSDYQFGEENNAWVEWVARPLLCYYKAVETQPDLRLQLLVPKENTSGCSQILP